MKATRKNSVSTGRLNCKTDFVWLNKTHQ